jgi:signal transduction histidine kinase
MNSGKREKTGAVQDVIHRLSVQPKLWRAAALVAATVFVGYLDYVTGPNLLMTAFYVVPLALAAWFLGFAFASLLALLSVAVWLVGNTLNHDATLATPLLIAWNATMEFALFMAVAFAVDRASVGHRLLETRVRERTATLEQLQAQVLQTSEAEQRRIGQDLHDGLCQHLAGAAYMCHALQEELAERGLDEARSAKDVVDMIKDGVSLARQTAKGLAPVEMDAEGLMHALADFAGSTSKLFDVSCRFACDAPVLISNRETANHLFRIAQESARNAITHGRAKNILISLRSDDAGTELHIRDDGIGIENAARTRSGMGLMIMPRRAAAIGATFNAAPAPTGGTIVKVVLPALAAPEVESHEHTDA